MKCISDKAPVEYQVRVILGHSLQELRIAFKATAQGILNAVYGGAGPIIGSFVGGYVYETSGPYVLWPLLITSNCFGAAIFGTMASYGAHRDEEKAKLSHVTRGITKTASLDKKHSVSFAENLDAIDTTRSMAKLNRSTSFSHGPAEASNSRVSATKTSPPHDEL